MFRSADRERTPALLELAEHFGMSSAEVASLDDEELYRLILDAWPLADEEDHGW
jgi:hypothetical protein